MEPPAGSGLSKVVLRVFGDNTDIFIDRARELKARAGGLSGSGIGPLTRVPPLRRCCCS